MTQRTPVRAAALASALVASALAHAEPGPATAPHPYVGLWVTDDGHIRHALLPDGRYDEARGRRQSAYQGRYTVTGDHIDYVDDTGFTADGTFVDGVLYHAGMVLRRVPADAGGGLPPRDAD
ncbi:Atu4866 domain-containing protein [Luteimonas sp. WGS1318]|uniref:Atu4866 domain-containing protein n=1 Tax=Luteimonas sp. WGS1318 TaxID=3366815 RepID=UPI00372D3877